MMIEHKDLSDRNRGAEYSGGIRKKVRGAVRHISEGLGAPSALEIADDEHPVLAADPEMSRLVNSPRPSAS